MNEDFRIFEYKSPYVFVSYSSKDRETVESVLERMYQDGFRFWYDVQGINGGERITGTITEHISQCAAFLIFFSKEFVTSDWCHDELGWAKSQGKTIIPVFLDDVTLPDKLTFKIQDIHRLKFQDLDTFMSEVCQTPEFYQCHTTPTLPKKQTVSVSGEKNTPTIQATNSTDNSTRHTVSFMHIHSTKPKILIDLLFMSLIDICILGFYSLGATIAHFFGVNFRILLLLSALFGFLLVVIDVFILMASFVFPALVFDDIHGILRIKNNVSWWSSLKNKHILSVVIEGNVNSISKFFLNKNCPHLESIYVEDSCQNYKSIGGVLFQQNPLGLIRYPAENSVHKYAIPSGTRYVGERAFENCYHLSGVIIPNSVLEIGSYAFANCSVLDNVNIPNGIQKISEGTFSNCSHLEAITIPDSVMEIGPKAFQGCHKLIRVNVPADAKIDDNAFDAYTHVTRRQFA